jgi:hypothetical protein
MLFTAGNLAIKIKRILVVFKTPKVYGPAMLSEFHSLN